MRSFISVCAALIFGAAPASANDEPRRLAPAEVVANLTGQLTCYDPDGDTCDAIAAPESIGEELLILREYSVIDLDLIVTGEFGDFLRTLPSVQAHGGLFDELARQRGARRYVKMVETQRLQHQPQHNIWCEAIPAANGFERIELWFSDSPNASVEGDVRVTPDVARRFADFFMQMSEDPGMVELRQQDESLGVLLAIVTSGVSLCTGYWATDTAPTLQAVTIHLPDGRYIESLTARAQTFPSDAELTLRGD